MCEISVCLASEGITEEEEEEGGELISVSVVLNCYVANRSLTVGNRKIADLSRVAA